MLFYNLFKSSKGLRKLAAPQQPVFNWAPNLPGGPQVYNPKQGATPQLTNQEPKYPFAYGQAVTYDTKGNVVSSRAPTKVELSQTDPRFRASVIDTQNRRSYTPESVYRGFGIGLKEGGKAALNGMAQGVIDIPDSLVSIPFGAANIGNYILYGSGRAMQSVLNSGLMRQIANSTGKYGQAIVGGARKGADAYTGFFRDNINDVKAAANTVRDVTGLTAARQYYNDFYAKEDGGVTDGSLKLAHVSGRAMPSIVTFGAAKGLLGSGPQKAIQWINKIRYPITNKMVSTATHNTINAAGHMMDAPRAAAYADRAIQTGLKWGSKSGEPLSLATYVSGWADAAGVPYAKDVNVYGRMARRILIPNSAVNGQIAEQGNPLMVGSVY